jgi:hypothetical protein
MMRYAEEVNEAKVSSVVATEGVAGASISSAVASEGRRAIKLHRCLLGCTGIQGGPGGRDPRSPLLLHQEEGWVTSPCPQQMQGYKNLLKLRIPTKTIRNSFLVMNRQIWTNQKRHLSTANAEEQACALCELCGEVENTMHLLFECARCYEPLWELAVEAITVLMRQASPAAQAYRIHAHRATYNICDGQFLWQHDGQVLAWFQEVKRDLIYRRSKRCTGTAIQPDWTRLLGCLINTLGRIVWLYNYQGRNAWGLKSCRDYLTQLIQ